MKPKNKTQLKKYLQVGMQLVHVRTEQIIKQGEVHIEQSTPQMKRTVNKVQTNAVNFTGDRFYDGVFTENGITKEKPSWLYLDQKDERHEFTDEGFKSIMQYTVNEGTEHEYTKKTILEYRYKEGA